jgi:fatty-acyl-CoA synthase
MNAVIDAISTYARARPDHPALVDLATGRSWTYAALHDEVDRIAAWLAAHLGPASGARVATLARNSAEMILLQHGCVRAGAIFVPLNWRLAPPEIETLLEDAEPALILHDADLHPPGNIGRRDLIARLCALAASAPAAPPALARQAADAPSTLLYTSGTSGRPKGVMITELNAFWGSTNFIHGNKVTWDSVFLCDMPLFHTAGLFTAARTPILAGGTLLVSQGFDADLTLARLADPALGVTHYFSVPQMAQVMWNRPHFNPSMLSRLSVYAMGGAPNPAAQVARFIRVGVPMSDGFGMTETGSNFGMPVDDHERVLSKPGSCGLPYLSLQVRIVDEDGMDVEVGEAGELWVSGPSVSPGYWNKPELTQSAFQDGWFRTGDLARRDADDFYWIVDRKKDMFISGGENVYPAEVEAALAELPAIAESAVIGVADEQWGEVGCAYIVVAQGHSLSAEAIRDHCRARLARFKTPKHVVLTDRIPRTASGKVQKHLLKYVASDLSGQTVAVPADSAAG